MLLTLDDVKLHLRIDIGDEDNDIRRMLEASEELCESITRLDFNELDNVPSIIKTAVLYGVTYLYENRESADYGELTNTLRLLLFGVRKEIF